MVDEQRKALIIAEIVGVLATETAFSHKGILMLAGVDKGYLSISIYSDRGRHIEYRQTQYSRYDKLLNNLWKMEPLSRRWEEVQFFFKGKHFQTRFIYLEDIDPDDLIVERWHQTAAEYFGGKPIKYPSWNDSDSWTM